MMDWLNQIVKLHPCSNAIEWAQTMPNPKAAWLQCERGDWMLWLLGKLAGPPQDDSRRRLVLATCDCAEPALKYVSVGENRLRQAIEAARQWARNENDVSLSDVRRAANAARAAYAAYAAAAAANVAAAAYAAAYAADRADILKQCAGIVRRHYPNPPLLGN